MDHENSFRSSNIDDAPSCIGATGGPTAHSQTKPFTVTVSVPNEFVESEAEVRVHIVLKNTSHQEITVGRPPDPVRGELHYAFQVRRSDSKVCMKRR